LSPQAAPAGNASKPGDIAGAYAARSSNGQPDGLTLEKLRLRFEENVYFARPGRGWFEWGVTWGRHKSYAKLSDFQAELGMDKGSRVAEPGFANLSGLDCRLSAGAMRAMSQSYPPGPVPGVLLGALNHLLTSGPENSYKQQADRCLSSSMNRNRLIGLALLALAALGIIVVLAGGRGKKPPAQQEQPEWKLEFTLPKTNSAGSATNTLPSR